MNKRQLTEEIEDRTQRALEALESGDQDRVRAILLATRNLMNALKE